MPSRSVFSTHSEIHTQRHIACRKADLRRLFFLSIFSYLMLLLVMESCSRLITQSALKELLLVTTKANRPRQHINRFLPLTSGPLNKEIY